MLREIAKRSIRRYEEGDDAKWFYAVISSLAGVLSQLLRVAYKDGNDIKWIEAIRCFHIVLKRTIEDSEERIRFVPAFRRLMRPQRFDGLVLMEMIDGIHEGLDDFVPGFSESLLLAACLDSHVSDLSPSDTDVLRWFENASTSQGRLACLNVLSRDIPSFNLLLEMFSKQPEILFRFASQTKRWYTQKDRAVEIVRKSSERKKIRHHTHTQTPGTYNGFREKLPEISSPRCRVAQCNFSALGTTRHAKKRISASSF